MKRLGFVTIALALAACSPPDGPRELPSPDFDARQAFPELEARGSDSNAADQAGSFEERIAQAASGGDDETTDAVSQQLVPLAGSFVTEMPSNFDEWQWSGDARTTLISYRESGATRPSALVYVESFSTLMRTSPSFEMNRFHRTVDPNLGQDLVPPALTSMAADLAARKTGLPVGKLVDTVMRSISHTMGAGLNYRSSEESFSGWKWVGSSRRDVDFRLARTDGRWAEKATYDPGIQRTLDQAAAQSGQFREVSEAYRELDKPDEGEQRNARPAWMLVGSASTTADSGIHVAILCESQPRCPVAEELSTMLAGIRAADASTLGRVGQPTAPSPAEKARELGLPYLPSSELVSPGELDSLLQQLRTQ